MNGLTNKGERAALEAPGFMAAAVSLHLYTTGSVPSKAGGGFVEPNVANGYAPIALNVAMFSFSVVQGVGRVMLGDQTFTAAGGSIKNVAGAFIRDADGDVIAWWSRDPETIPNGETRTLSGLYVG